MIRKLLSFPSNLNTSLFTLVVALFLAGNTSSLAQSGPQSNLKERYLELARTYAYSENYDTAQFFVDKAIGLDNSYLEARTFRARLFGFQKEFEAGIIVAKGVLREDREYTPAYLVLSDLYIWSGQRDLALNTVKNGLYFSPSNVELLEKKAALEYELGQKEESAQSTRDLLYYDPANETGLELQGNLKKEIHHNDVGIIYNLDSYENILGNANALSYYWTRRTNLGPLTVRLNQAIRQGRTGFQLEADFYPKLTKNSYLYLNAGFSASDLYPALRLGGEYYRTFDKSWEASLGFRYLQFNSEVRPLLLTGQLGKYFRSNWVSGRMYLGLDGGPENTRSFVFLYRHYYKSPLQWIGVTLAFGYIPELRNMQNASSLRFDPATGLPIYVAKTRRFGISFQQPLGPRWWGRLTLGGGQQEQEQFIGIYDEFFWGSIQFNYSF